MTTLQKAFVTATLAVVTGAGIYEARQAFGLRDEVKMLQRQQAPLAEQVRHLQQERDDATQKLAALREENDRLRQDAAELAKLRGEVASFRANAREQVRLKAAENQTDQIEAEAKSLLDRVNRLKQKLEETPTAKIPELQFLADADWVNPSSGNLDTETDFRKAFSILRDASERNFLKTMQPALQKFLKANNDQFPTDVSQLKPYFDPVPSDEVLQRYKIVSAAGVPGETNAGDFLITLKGVVDEENDAQYTLGRSSIGAATYQFAQAYTILAPAIQALKASAPTNNSGRQKFDISQLLPYLTTTEQKAAYYKLTHQAP